MAEKNNPGSSRLTRRQFLKLIGLSGLSAFLAECRPFKAVVPTPTAGQTVSTLPPAASATAIPVASIPTKPLVAIGQVRDYEPEHLYAELKQMLSGLGGLADLVKPGAHVGIKPNLTGGTSYDSNLSVPATELYVTHPALIGELVKLFFEAGAGKVTILEALGDENTYSQWGYTEMARATGAELIDLNKPDPYSSFQKIPVPPTINIYDSFQFNQVLREVDVFVSVPKMKCHATAGVTHSMKNLFGIVPVALYRRNAEDGHRSLFHDTEKFDRRVPRIIVDLNRARPVHLSVIDGILTSEGGEGPWIESLRPVQPGLIVAGKNPVATDSVATALMGFDPAGASGTLPYTHGDNHIALAAAAGLGTNRLEEIDIIGPSIESVRFPFKPVD